MPKRLLFFVSIALSLPAAAEVTAVHCGRLFDASSEKLLGEHTVVIEGNRIREVHAANVVVEGATAIDLSRQTCLPGLIDMHVHLGNQTSAQAYSEGFRLNPEDFAFRVVGYAERTLLAGFTSVRDLGGNVALWLRNAIDQGWCADRGSALPANPLPPPAVTPIRSTASTATPCMRSATPALKMA